MDGSIIDDLVRELRCRRQGGCDDLYVSSISVWSPDPDFRPDSTGCFLDAAIQKLIASTITPRRGDEPLSGRRVVAALSAALLLAACGPLSIRNEATRSYVPLRNASLELHRDVVVAPERARVFFQDGEVLPGINEYRPHCELTVRKLADRPQTIQADRFTVERVSADIVHVVSSGAVVVAVNAELRLAGGGGDGGGDGEGRLMKAYILYLHSDRQPEVLSLVCGGAFNLPALATRPSLEDIRNALGDYATLELH